MGPTNEVNPTDDIFSFFNVVTVCMLSLFALIMLSSRLLCKVHQYVPISSLKAPVICILLAPLLMQLANLCTLIVPLQSGFHPLVAVVSKLYLALVFYCFYLLLREVVFFEQLLRGHEGDHADPEFNDASSVSSLPSYTPSTSNIMQALQWREFRQQQRQARSQRNQLREQLVSINYDQAREEEAILNRVFPQ